MAHVFEKGIRGKGGGVVQLLSATFANKVESQLQKNAEHATKGALVVGIAWF